MCYFLRNSNSGHVHDLIRRPQHVDRLRPALLADSPVVDPDDMLHILNRLQPMGDDQVRVFQPGTDLMLHLVFQPCGNASI